jgi:hypothetical protein
MFKVIRSNTFLALALLLSIPAFAAQQAVQTPAAQASVASKLWTGIKYRAAYPTRASLLALKDRVATGAVGLSCRLLDTCRTLSFPSWQTIKDVNSNAAIATKQAYNDTTRKAAEYGQIALAHIIPATQKAMTFARQHPRIAAASLATALAFGFVRIKTAAKSAQHKQQLHNEFENLATQAKAAKNEYTDPMRYYVEPEPEILELTDQEPVETSPEF